MFCILAAMSSVRSAVVPPAPQVMSQNVGPYDAMRSCLSNKFSTPWRRPVRSIRKTMALPLNHLKMA